MRFGMAFLQTMWSKKVALPALPQPQIYLKCRTSINQSILVFREWFFLPHILRVCCESIRITMTECSATGGQQVTWMEFKI